MVHDSCWEHGRRAIQSRVEQSRERQDETGQDRRGQDGDQQVGTDGMLAMPPPTGHPHKAKGREKGPARLAMVVRPLVPPPSA